MCRKAGSGDITEGAARGWLAISILIALIIRLAYVISVGNDVRWPDETEYHGIAINLIEGKGYSYFRGVSGELSPTAYRAPGLPAFLALIYLLTGPSLLAARIGQAMLGAALIPIGFLIGRELGLSRRAGLIACAALALYPYYIFCAGAVYPIVLSTILVGLATLALLRGRSRPGVAMEIAAGVVLGLASLTFGHVLAAAPLVALWVVLNKQARRNSALIAAVAFVLAFSAALAPWVVRNALMLGRPTLSTAFEYNLCMGNAEQAKWDSGSRVSDLESAHLKGRVAKLSEGDAARLYMRVAREEISSAPGRFVLLSMGKAANFWRPYPNPAARSVSTLEKAVGLLTYGPAFIGCVVWLIGCRSRLREVSLLLAYPAASMIVAAVTVSVDRYRLPFDIYLIILASAALMSWIGGRNTQSVSE